MPIHLIYSRHPVRGSGLCKFFLLVATLISGTTAGFPFCCWSSKSLILMAAATPTAGSNEGLRDIGGTCVVSKNDQSDPRETVASASQPPWVHALNNALEANKADMHSRFVQLATIAHFSFAKQETTDVSENISPQGLLRPRVRWVVFRGFLNENTTTFKVITDSRSEKIKEILQNPYGEISWYFIQTREQFRLAGRCQLVTADELDPVLAVARHDQWAALSDNARKQFSWPAPGLNQDSDGISEDTRKALYNPPPVPGTSPPPETFVLLLFHPFSVDHLQLRPNPQVRTVHETVQWSINKQPDGIEIRGEGVDESDAWAARRVNP
ncbi:pyridoxamine 5 -phosphate oxidase- fmn-binding protein [Nannochloropsis gaditana]|uniref:Pyridoxamine 5-phosphate oxidase-fmn-binding protein n=1 Tax=Nannochloropsis gaditana TaxID=72520 RepID=W7T755_9STRA|nr:pyridoxamine 5 -phosphate oxidase- fmn-binding protein [Nannochloropsis gaditana]